MNKISLKSINVYLLCEVQSHDNNNHEKETDHAHHHHPEHNPQAVNLVPIKQGQHQNCISYAAANTERSCIRSSRYGKNSVDSSGPVVAFVERVTEEHTDPNHPADNGGIVDLSSVSVLHPQTLPKGLPGYDGQPCCSFLEGVSQDRSEYKSPDHSHTVLCSCSCTGYNCTRTYCTGCQHGPVQHGGNLRPDVGQFHPDYLNSKKYLN